MNDPIAHNRFAPPRAEVADPVFAPDGEPELASRWARLGAALIDLVIYLVIYFAVMLPMYGLRGFRGATESMSQTLPGLVLYLTLTYGLNAFFLWRSSQTPGKMALGLRIVRSDGSHVGFGRVFALRMLLPASLTMIPWIGSLTALVDCLFIFGAARRCLHDYVADTIVVDAAWAPPPHAGARA